MSYGEMERPEMDDKNETPKMRAPKMDAGAGKVSIMPVGNPVQVGHFRTPRKNFTRTVK